MRVRRSSPSSTSRGAHELYFDSLGGDGTSGGVVDEALKRTLEVDRWRAESSGWGKRSAAVSGWVLLTYSHPTTAGESMGRGSYARARRCRPILALDMYEHSYQFDYGASAERITSMRSCRHRLANAVQLSRGSRSLKVLNGRRVRHRGGRHHSTALAHIGSTPTVDQESRWFETSPGSQTPFSRALVLRVDPPVFALAHLIASSGF